MTSSVRYDHPNVIVRREECITNITGIASTTMRKWMKYQKCRVKQVHALVVTAGTNTDAGVDILNGTTSVGAITVGTNTAGYTASSGVLNSTLASLTALDIKGKATSATMVLSFSIEYEMLPDSEMS